MNKSFGLLLCFLCATPWVQAADVANGWRVILEQRLGNCTACHSMPNEHGKKTGVQSTFAPQLDGVATRYATDVLRQWVVDARNINPNTLMPPFGLILSVEQLNDALAALETLR